MTSVSTDRRFGVNSGSAIKVPVKAASTANLTLSGEQTVDGVALVTNDRILVKNQTTGANNGIYIVDTGVWARAADWDGTYDIRKGTLVYVANGTVSSGLFYVVTTSDPITIGTTSVTLQASSNGTAITIPLPVTQGGTGGGSAISGLSSLGVIQVTAEGGTANSQTGTIDALVTALRADQLFIHTPSITNTGPTTVTYTPSGGGALAAKNVFAGGAALVGGEMMINVPTILQFDGTQLNIIGSLPAIDSRPLVIGSADATKKVRLEVDGLTTATTRVLTAQDQDGTISLGFQGMFKNRLINPDGAVYSRAVAATADDTYFADNWYVLSQTGTVTPSVLTDPEDGFPKGIRITQSQAAAQRYGFAQIIEGRNCKDLRGRSGVLVPRVRFSTSAALRYAILGWTGTEDTVTSDVVNDWTSPTYTAGNFFLGASVSVIAVGSMTPSAATWTSLTALTAALGSTFNNIIVMVWTEATTAQNATLDFDYVQFERGNTATDFERRANEQEIALCQRYLPSFFCATITTRGTMGNGHAVNGTTGTAYIPFQTKARIAPTAIITSAASDFAFTDGAGTGIACTTLNFQDSSEFGAKIQPIVAAGLTAGAGGMFYGITGATSRLLFTGAEL